jgi:oligopeptidase A
MENPLLEMGKGLPAYEKILPEHVQPAISNFLSKGYEVLKLLETASVNPSWESLIAPLEDANRSFRTSMGSCQPSHKCYG